MAIQKFVAVITASGAFAILSSAFAQSPTASAASAAATSLHFDKPMDVNGVSVVCTGVGDSDESNPLWADYPVKVVTAGKDGQWLGGATITIKSGGKDLATVSCGGPWTLFKVSPGRYDVTATIQDESKSGVVFAKAGGQGRVILRFLNRGGAISAEHVPATQ